MRLMTKWFLVAGLSVALAACGTSSDPDIDGPEADELIQENAVVDVAADAGLTTFVEGLETSFGDDEFRFVDGGSYTFFAPTNTAFAEADQASLDSEDLLEYHVVEGALTLDDLESGPLETLSGPPIEISVDGGTVSINGTATVTEPNNLEAVNGVVHAIDSVLAPPDAPEDDEGDDLDDPEEEPEATSYQAELLSTSEEAAEEASGQATATLDGNTLIIEGSVQGLSGEITAVGLYEGGGDDEGTFFYDVEFSGSTFSDTLPLDQEDLAVLRNDDFYINVSTDAFPDAEVSGPLIGEN